jgi:hypothetical protein
VSSLCASANKPLNITAAIPNTSFPLNSTAFSLVSQSRWFRRTRASTLCG